MQPIKIGIVGAGNVGRVLSVILSAEGYQVESVLGASQNNISIDNYFAYNIAGDFGDMSYLVRVLDDIDNLSENLDIIFVCTKVFDGEQTLSKLKSKLSQNGAIVTIQNVFWVDKVSRYISAKNSVCIYLDFACKTINNTTYVLNSDGIKIGIYNKDAYQIMHNVKEVLSNVCKVKETRDIIGLSLGRNILNTAISSLGAISGLNLKDILEDRNGRYLFVKMIEEEVSLFEHFGLKIVPYDNKLDYYKFVENSFKGKISRFKILSLLKKNNGHIQSSALREFENGKKSELLILIESFVRHAKHCGIKTPYVSTIFQMLKEIENGDRRITEDAFYDKNLVNIDRR